MLDWASEVVTVSGIWDSLRPWHHMVMKFSKSAHVDECRNLHSLDSYGYLGLSCNSFYLQSHRQSWHLETVTQDNQRQA
jgi:hypothetical protein